MSTPSENVCIEMTPDGVAHIILSRPEKHNALNTAMIGELTHSFSLLGRQALVRVIILRAEGENFCSGADLKDMHRAATQDESENHNDALNLGRLFHTIKDCPKPVIALAKGAVRGGGVGLVAAADLVVASPDASFALTEVRLGLIPAVISPFVIARIGATAARLYMLTAESFDAFAARHMGLVTLIDDHPDQGVRPLIEALLKNAPGAIAETKALMARVTHAPIDQDLLEDTASRIAKRRTTDEAREGLSAFFDKRLPRWVSP